MKLPAHGIAGGLTLRRFAILVLVALALAPPPGGSAATGALPDLAALSALAGPLEPPVLEVPALALPVPLDLPEILGGAPPPPDCGNVADAGDGWDEATAIAVPVACSGTVGAGDDVDLFVFDVEALTSLRAVVTPPSSEARFEVCFATPHRIVVACGSNEAFPAKLVTNETGAWYVAVVRVWGEGAYDLGIEAAPVAPEPADCIGAPGPNDAADAAPFAWPASCAGSTRFLDDVRDWYFLEGDALQVSVTGAVACLYLADDPLHPVSCNGVDGRPAYAATPGHGGYLLQVFSTADGSYHFSVVAAPTQDDCGAGLDAPGNLYLGLPMASSCSGELSWEDAADVLSVSVPEGLAMGVTATFAPDVPAYLCVIPHPDGPPGPWSCEVAWSGGLAVGGAPAGPARDVIIAVVSAGNSSYTVATETHVPTAQDDCATGADAPDDGVARSMPLDCDGAIVAVDGDVWDIYRVEVTEGPVYGDLFALFDAELCFIDATFTNGACSSRGELDVSWPAGPMYVAVVRVGGSGSYHLGVEQQDDCGTGADALWSGAEVTAPLLRCEAMLDTFVGDAEDAFLVPPPLAPDVVVVRMEPTVPRMRLCVDDEVRQAGLRSRCTDSTFSRILVARDPLRPIRVTVEGFSVDPFGYTLIVEDPREHPPQVPPLL